MEKTKLLTQDDEKVKEWLSRKRYRKNLSEKEKNQRINRLKSCDHPSVRYSETEFHFICKKCNEKLIYCDFRSYKMFCLYAQIPITRLLEN